MKTIMINANGKHYIRITKTEARNRFKAGEFIAIRGIKDNSTCFPSFSFNPEDPLTTFDVISNSWEYYNNCYYGYPCFYLIREY